MNREESKVTHIVKIPRETIDCAKCKHCGEQTCVPYGFSCQYDPIIPRSTVRISQKQINDINKIVKQLQQENNQLKDNWNKLKEYCQNNSFMQNTREYGTLTVVDADELAIYMEELEKSDSNE